MLSLSKRLVVVCVVAVFASSFRSIIAEAGPAAVLRIDAGGAGTNVSPALFGVFFEDINYGADGGLYPELVRNGSFESRLDAEGWQASGGASSAEIEILRRNPPEQGNLRYVRVRASGRGRGIANEGYWGMGFDKGESYAVSAYVRSDDAKAPALSFVLEDSTDGILLGSFDVSGIGKEWKRIESVITASRTTDSGRLGILATTPGSFELDTVSVFPGNTFKSRPNGLRADLASMIAELEPGFFRFPGGCVVEGRSIATAYRWKDTIGEVAERRGNENVWGYRQSYGLGFFEYLQFCEDLGAEPLPVVNCGMACQARNGDMVAMGDLGPWIQDALDLIEYANGDEGSEWGSRRAASGHPRPFGLKALAIGNEQWGNEYYPRYEAFARAIKAKHPEIRLVFAAGPVASGTQFDDAWERARKLGADLVDEHYYMTPEWLLENTRRYDAYDRNGPTVVLGEYAAKSNTLYAALAEAAFMTGLERNGDVVEYASYAPLLARAGHAQWTPDLIWFDGSDAYGSPNYYVQKLFGKNRSAASLPCELSVSPEVSRRKPLGGGIGLGTWGTRADFKDIEVVDRDGRPLFSPSLEGLDGWLPGAGMWMAKDGTASQRSGFADCRLVYAGTEDWSDYTLRLKARKVSGNEGVMVMFGVRGTDYYCWNLGGWGNTASAVERGSSSSRTIVGGTAPLKVEADRWYDLRVELRGETIRCFLDGALVHELRACAGDGPIYAHAGRGSDGSYIVKLVNLDPETRTVRIELADPEPLEGWAAVTVLTGPGLTAVNTFDDPRAVYPMSRRAEGISKIFFYTLDPTSLSILRIPVKNR